MPGFEQEQSVQALRQALENLEATLSALPDLLFEVDSSGRILDYRAPRPDLLYSPPAQFLGKTVSELLPMPAADAALAAIAQAAIHGSSTGTEYYLDMPSGGSWYELSVAAKKERQLTPGRFVVLVRDVTKRKQAEAALRHNEEFLRAVVDSSPLGITVRDRAGKLLSYNPAWQRIWGFTDEYIANDMRRQDQQLTLDETDDYCKPWWNEIQQVFSHGGTFYIKETCTRPYYQGPVEWVSLHFYAITDHQQAVDRVIVITQDVTERKRAEEDIRHAKEFSQLLLQHSSDIIIILNPDGTQRYVSPAALRITGFHPDELTGKSLAEIIHPDDLPRVMLAWQDIITNPEQVLKGEYRHVHKSGGWVNLEAVGQCLLADPFVRGVVVSVRDISERKRAEAEREAYEARLRQSQKIEALGTLAGGIAHDFNNLLFAILGNAELVTESLDQGSADYESMQSLISAGTRAKDLVQQILTFSRKAEILRESVDLRKVIAEALRMLQRAIPSSISIRQQIAPVTQQVIADPTEIYQVLMNLCMNSAQAIEPGTGEITIALHEVDVRHAFDPRYTALTPGPYLELVVSDTGRGIPSAILAKVFDPYFTTKDKGRGTGLGLAVVHGIVMQLGGSMWLESTEGHGTSATILFPAVEAQPQLESSVIVSAQQLRGKILVVDDELDNLRLMQQMLAALGLEATCCESPVRALELLLADPQGYRAVITDQTMPHLTGLQLALKLRQQAYQGPIVLYTGYGESLDSARVVEAGIMRILSKPLSRNTLKQTLELALGD